MSQLYEGTPTPEISSPSYMELRDADDELVELIEDLSETVEADPTPVRVAAAVPIDVSSRPPMLVVPRLTRIEQGKLQRPSFKQGYSFKTFSQVVAETALSSTRPYPKTTTNRQSSFARLCTSLLDSLSGSLTNPRMPFMSKLKTELGTSVWLVRHRRPLSRSRPHHR